MAGSLVEAGLPGVSDGGAGGSALRRAVGAVTGWAWRVAGGSEVHPPWCARKRCEFINPPVNGRVVPRHRGSVVLLGDRLTNGGSVMTWLMGRPGSPVVVGFHAASRVRGGGGAELVLSDVWRLARRLDQLLADAGFVPPVED